MGKQQKPKRSKSSKPKSPKKSSDPSQPQTALPTLLLSKLTSPDKSKKESALSALSLLYISYPFNGDGSLGGGDNVNNQIYHIQVLRAVIQSITLPQTQNTMNGENVDITTSIAAAGCIVNILAGCKSRRIVGVLTRECDLFSVLVFIVNNYKGTPSASSTTSPSSSSSKKNSNSKDEDKQQNEKANVYKKQYAQYNIQVLNLLATLIELGALPINLESSRRTFGVLLGQLVYLSMNDIIPSVRSAGIASGSGDEMVTLNIGILSSVASLLHTLTEFIPLPPSSDKKGRDKDKDANDFVSTMQFLVTYLPTLLPTVPSTPAQAQTQTLTADQQNNNINLKTNISKSQIHVIGTLQNLTPYNTLLPPTPTPLETPFAHIISTLTPLTLNSTFFLLNESLAMLKPLGEVIDKDEIDAAEDRIVEDLVGRGGLTSRELARKHNSNKGGEVGGEVDVVVDTEDTNNGGDDMSDKDDNAIIDDSNYQEAKPQTAAEKRNEDIKSKYEISLAQFRLISLTLNVGLEVFNDCLALVCKSGKSGSSGDDGDNGEDEDGFVDYGSDDDDVDMSDMDDADNDLENASNTDNKTVSTILTHNNTLTQLITLVTNLHSLLQKSPPGYIKDEIPGLINKCLVLLDFIITVNLEGESSSSNGGVDFDCMGVVHTLNSLLPLSNVNVNSEDDYFNVYTSQILIALTTIYSSAAKNIIASIQHPSLQESLKNYTLFLTSNDVNTRKNIVTMIGAICVTLPIKDVNAFYYNLELEILACLLARLPLPDSATTTSGVEENLIVLNEIYNVIIDIYGRDEWMCLSNGQGYAANNIAAKLKSGLVRFKSLIKVITMAQKAKMGDESEDEEEGEEVVRVTEFKETSVNVGRFLKYKDGK